MRDEAAGDVYSARPSVVEVAHANGMGGPLPSVTVA